MTGPASAPWPVDLRGVTESVVTTQGPEGRWNVAALGLHADAGEAGGDDGASTADGATDTDGREGTEDEGVRARTWGRTRTRHNFETRGEGYVQFTRDPLDFVEAALAVREEVEPVLDSADAWVRVSVAELDRGREGGTEWVDWYLRPEEASVERETVPTTNRGYNAVVEATVAASRLDVERYDSERLRERLSHLEGVVERCGGDRERVALARLRELVEW